MQTQNLGSFVWAKSETLHMHSFGLGLIIGLCLSFWAVERQTGKNRNGGEVKNRKKVGQERKGLKEKELHEKEGL